MPTYEPRNDFVILRKQKKIAKSGLSFASGSLEGTKFIVHAIGPDVEGLKVGHSVMLVGATSKPEDVVVGVVGETDLMFLRQHCIAYIIWEDD